MSTTTKITYTKLLTQFGTKSLIIKKSTDAPEENHVHGLSNNECVTPNVSQRITINCVIYVTVYTHKSHTYTPHAILAIDESGLYRQPCLFSVSMWIMDVYIIISLLI